jgi:DMSO/TMAO reductase YedYZ molybdopterin-dependent catalytic subunit
MLERRVSIVIGASIAWLVPLVINLAGLATAEVQAPAASNDRAPGVVLSVGGSAPRPLKLTDQEFSRLPRRTVSEKDRDGKVAEFEGVPLFELLKAAGVEFGPGHGGPALVSYLVVEAADGYRAIFALPELDPALTDRVILVADRRQGKPLGANEGPLRIIVPGEKRHSRWVRQVIAIRVGKA